MNWIRPIYKQAGHIADMDATAASATQDPAVAVVEGNGLNGGTACGLDNVSRGTLLFLNKHFPNKHSRGLGSTIFEGVPVSTREGLVLWECASGYGLDTGYVELRAGETLEWGPCQLGPFLPPFRLQGPPPLAFVS